MSFIDKLKSKLKSSDTDELLASIPGIKKQAKDFATDFGTMNKTAQQAIVAAGLKAKDMNSGGSDDFEKARRDYELALGGVDRTLTDYKLFIGTYAGFLASLEDVQSAIDKAKKKEKDAPKLKQLDAALKELAALKKDGETDLKLSQIKSLEKYVADGKQVVLAAKKQFDKVSDTCEKLADMVIADCKKATKFFRAANDAAVKLLKSTKAEDIRGGLEQLKAFKDAENKHTDFDLINKRHIRKMDEVHSSLHGFDGNPLGMLPPRVKKEVEGALATYASEKDTIAKLSPKLTGEVKKLKDKFGV